MRKSTRAPPDPWLVCECGRPLVRIRGFLACAKGHGRLPEAEDDETRQEAFWHNCDDLHSNEED